MPRTDVGALGIKDGAVVVVVRGTVVVVVVGVAGRTPILLDDPGEVPYALAAATRNLYSVPLVRLVTTVEVNVAIPSSNSIHVLP